MTGTFFVPVYVYPKKQLEFPKRIAPKFQSTHQSIDIFQKVSWFHP